jgi:ACT domain-containing protein
MHKEVREELNVRLKLVVLELANHFGVIKACKEFNVSRSTFYSLKNGTTFIGNRTKFGK